MNKPTMQWRKLLRLRCTACGGQGKQYDQLRDDASASGYRRVERPCPACDAGVVQRPMPRASKLPGITSAVAWVPLGVVGSFDHPTVRLRPPKRDWEDEPHTALTITLQRGRLSAADDLRYAGRPDERFDVGPVAWSAAYAARIESEHGGGFRVAYPEDLAQATKVVAHLARAMEQLPRGYSCELAQVVDALEVCGVPVELRYHGERVTLSRDAVLAEVAAGRMVAGAGSRLLAERDAKAGAA